MLLDVKVARVQERPERSLISLGKDEVPELAEDVGDDEDEEGGDGERGGSEVEAEERWKRSAEYYGSSCITIRWLLTSVRERPRNRSGRDLRGEERRSDGAIRAQGVSTTHASRQRSPTPASH